MATTTAANVSVTTAATRISPEVADGTATLLLRNDGAQVVYLGGSTVTAATGIPLQVGDTYTLRLSPGDVLYGITSTATATVRRTLLGA